MPFFLLSITLKEMLAFQQNETFSSPPDLPLSQSWNQLSLRGEVVGPFPGLNVVGLIGDSIATVGGQLGKDSCPRPLHNPGRHF